MNSFQIIEVLSILAIIGIQIFSFYTTYLNILKLKSIFPDVSNFSIEKISLKDIYLNKHPKDILNNLDKYVNDSSPKIILNELYDDDNKLIRPVKYEEDKRVAIDLIACKVKSNETTNKICNSLNTYLIRNRGIASDFHLIKDIVERNTDAKVDEINQTISLPLYLGLLGTFIGIVIGLFQISGIDFSSDSQALDIAISTLLNGVMIAMIASFFGLLLMIFNSGYHFKSTKILLEDNKNDFYTFIQTDLLPLLNQNINSTLYSLQNNLHKFNEDFKGNIDGLNSIMGKNHDALIAQEKILTSLEGIDINAFAKANVMVLKELQFSVEKFSQFNQYLDSVNSFVSTSGNYTTKVNELIDRTENFKLIGNHIIEVFEENKKLNEFLQNHYSSLDESHQLINKSVNNVNNTLDESLNQLKSFTQERIAELQKITLTELDLLQNQYPEKWKKLDNLSHLEKLSKDLNDIKMSSASQIGSLKSEMDNFNKQLIKAVTVLESIEAKKNRLPFFNNFFNKIKKWILK